MRLRALRKCLLHVITKPENAALSKSNSTDEEVVEIRENATAPIIICFRSRRAQSPGVQYLPVSSGIAWRPGDQAPRSQELI